MPKSKGLTPEDKPGPDETFKGGFAIPQPDDKDTEGHRLPEGKPGEAVGPEGIIKRGAIPDDDETSPDPWTR